jgi:hypothetical protein
VRLLQWQNNFLDLDKNMTRITARYKEEAQFLLAGDLTSFVKGAKSEPDTMILSHPPGYPMVIALIYKISGNSDRALRLFQIACEAVTVVLIFLIAARLIPRGAALISALLAAVAPQLAFRSLVLLPETLAVHRRKAALAVILTPPLYYLSSHAPMHFEYRYILPVYFFWFILAGLAIYWIGLMFIRLVNRRRSRNEMPRACPVESHDRS